jgi:hypothetical protein
MAAYANGRDVASGAPEVCVVLAAVDRLVHHATILEMNVDSYRRRTALPTKRQ